MKVFLQSELEAQTGIWQNQTPSFLHVTDFQQRFNQSILELISV